MLLFASITSRLCTVSRVSRILQCATPRRPKKGSAILFFPAAGGIPNVPFDIRTLHCGEVVAEGAANEKWIAQLWLRERDYTPTAPPDNNHENAFDAIAKHCDLAKL